MTDAATTKPGAKAGVEKMSPPPQALLDKIELRRFVGREFLLWLWFESELYEATLSTKKHGSFGLWLEGRLVLDAGQESTVIKGSAPGHHREAKEALLRGKTPSRAGLHLSIGDREITLTLRGEMLALAGLSGPKKAEKEEPGEAATLAMPPPPPRKKKRSGGPTTPEDDDAHESFYERMRHAHDVEELMTTLYQDFLALRLSSAWDAQVRPALERWARGEEIDERRYDAARASVMAPRRKN